MTDQIPGTDGQSTTDTQDVELEAIQAVLKALASLQGEQRQRVIDYVFQRLGLKPAQFAAIIPQQVSPVFAQPQTMTPVAGGHTPIRDIRSFKEAKRPRSANEMAALVAYYLSELAPEGTRKTEIGTDDITTYFKQAGYPLPSVLRNTLVNAKASGYFDSAAHGLYKLNPVGHNLVVHGLPPTGVDSAQAARPKRSSRNSASKGARHK